MIFIVTGEGEHGPVTTTCETPVSALQQARRLADDGIKGVLIDADGQEYAPADFRRLFVEPGSSGT
jgi:hypothetical protein